MIIFLSICSQGEEEIGTNLNETKLAMLSR